jgi:DUF4097 and DUF4098 domain-containing protein YvlB
MKVSVNNSYGSVKVTGGASAIRATLIKGVRGWSEDDARKIADKIKLFMNQTSDGLTITTNRDQFSQQFTTDIQVEVPGLSSVSVTDSYGSISANDICGGLTVKASYGQADIRAIRGDVKLDLSYSDVNASNVEGDLVINGAKRARISNVAGSVQLSASNGSVELRDVSGAVHVDAPFCRIVAQGLDQTAELKTEHAGVDVSRAADVVIDALHSDVRAKSIRGDLSVMSSNSNIQLASITGELEVQAEQSSVNVDDVRGGVSIVTSHGDVVVRNFYEGVHVETSYRDVTLVAASEPTGDINVQNNHGQIKLVLPQSSRFNLNAESANGQIQPVGFSQLEQKVRDSLVAVLGLDGPTIKLRTSYKNIIIQASAARHTPATAVVN